MTFEKQSSSPAAIYSAFPAAPSAEPGPVHAVQAGGCWAALVLSRRLPPVRGWFWFVKLNATFTAGTAALQEAEPSCLTGVLGQASWEEKPSVCP